MLDGWERSSSGSDARWKRNGCGCMWKEGHRRSGSQNIKFVKQINEHAPLVPERTSKVDTRQRKEADLRICLSDLST